VSEPLEFRTLGAARGRGRRRAARASSRQAAGGARRAAPEPGRVRFGRPDRGL